MLHIANPSQKSKVKNHPINLSAEMNAQRIEKVPVTETNLSVYLSYLYTFPGCAGLPFRVEV
jgi:hypothetical protein